MSFLYIAISPKEKEVPGLKENSSGIPENKNAALLAAGILEGG